MGSAQCDDFKASRPGIWGFEALRIQGQILFYIRGLKSASDHALSALPRWAPLTITLYYYLEIIKCPLYCTYIPTCLLDKCTPIVNIIINLYFMKSHVDSEKEV